jgi:hypothetical protein
MVKMTLITHVQPKRAQPKVFETPPASTCRSPQRLSGPPSAWTAQWLWRPDDAHDLDVGGPNINGARAIVRQAVQGVLDCAGDVRVGRYAIHCSREEHEAGPEGGCLQGINEVIQKERFAAALL